MRDMTAPSSVIAGEPNSASLEGCGHLGRTNLPLFLWRYCDGNSDEGMGRRYSFIKDHQKTPQKPRWLQPVLVNRVENLREIGLWIRLSNHL